MAARSNTHARTGTREILVTTYGVLMSPAEVAAVLKLPSREALAAARARGAISLTPLRVQGRRERVYRTEDVAALIDSWPADSPKENGM